MTQFKFTREEVLAAIAREVIQDTRLIHDETQVILDNSLLEKFPNTDEFGIRKVIERNTRAVRTQLQGTNRKGRLYLPEEDAVIREFVPKTHPKKWGRLLPGRDKRSVYYRAREIGVELPNTASGRVFRNKRFFNQRTAWTPDQIEHLRSETARGKTPRDLSIPMGRSVMAIEAQLDLLKRQNPE